jgi:hypothetical protein
MSATINGVLNKVTAHTINRFVSLLLQRTKTAEEFFDLVTHVMARCMTNSGYVDTCVRLVLAVQARTGPEMGAGEVVIRALEASMKTFDIPSAVAAYDRQDDINAIHASKIRILSHV